MENRQLAAIMFTDIVGYTALMGKDEEKTLELLHKYHQIQKSTLKMHNGIFVKEIGDGMLAYFTDARKAIECGIEIQKNLSITSEADIRIGLHWAEIFIEAGDIYGDGVNIASRIESLADPGGIYISEALHKALEDEGLTNRKLLGSAKLKNVKEKIAIYAVMGDSLPPPSLKRFQALANPRKKFAVVPTVIAFLIIILIAILMVKYLNDRTKKIEAEASLEEIDDILETNWRNYADAFYLAKEAELIIPDNERLQSLIKQTSVNIDITTDPPGADVFYKIYNKPEEEWQSLGITPIKSIQLPVSALRWKIEKEGYETVMAASLTYTFKNLNRMKRSEMYTGQNFHRILDKKGTIPPDMVRVSGGNITAGHSNDFYLDKFEVRNKDYKLFIEEGGYENPIYWEELTSQNNGSLYWQKIVNSFVDRSGLPGPSTWTDQKYTEGEDNYPVTGINWFEANAYARYVGKNIPTKDHWGLGRGEGTFLIRMPQVGGNAYFAPYSNFHGEGPVETGFFDGITSFGAYDMAGNVREWCWNESEQGRWVRGGAWNDNPYMFGAPSQADPFDRSARNGFRCALYPEPDSIPEIMFAYAESPSRNKWINLPQSITESQFEAYKTYYEYDQLELNDTIVRRTENDKGWILEKVLLDAAYDNERVITYLFLPTNTDPPFQSVMYGPGANVLNVESSDDLENFFEYSVFCEFLVRNGRVVIFPVFKGSFERRGKESFRAKPGTHQYTTNISRIIKDYRRCLDYMESREEFDLNKIAFYGVSMGPLFGSYLSAVDHRIKANVFYAGGLNRMGRPEADMAYFLPRVKVPTLMINGRFDSIFPLDAIMGMYNLLGTTDDQKKLVLFESDHLAPMADVISETNLWLDQHFGKVDYTIDIEPVLGSIIMTPHINLH
jgi:class 3 adenylate cyclase/dienelactone hydrolase